MKTPIQRTSRRHRCRPVLHSIGRALVALLAGLFGFVIWSLERENNRAEESGRDGARFAQTLPGVTAARAPTPSPEWPAPTSSRVGRVFRFELRCG